MKTLQEVLHFLLSVIDGAEPNAPAKVAEARAAVDAHFAEPEQAEPESEPEG